MTATISQNTVDFFQFCLPALRWAPPMALSEWADENAYISPEGSAEPGRWRTLPYQRGIQDAMTDPAVERVSVIKSARVGYTRMVGNLIGYHIHHDPCSMMMVQPTIEDAENYSKDEFATMVRDTDCLLGLVGDSGKRKDTLNFKRFPGGSLRFIGSNSAAGFRRVTIRVMIFDEVDGYPLETENEGDPVSLGIKRTETYWNRLIVAGSTPTDGQSRIAKMFRSGDRRRYHVPCPYCGHMHALQFKNLKWPEGDPLAACFQCPQCEEAISHDKKTWMVERGKWIAEKPFNGHASFHLWSAYSYAVNATWGHIAAAFLESREGGPRILKTFINTWLGEVWHDATEAPDWNVLYSRREPYKRGVIPDGAKVVTAGVDVQKDRLEVEVVAWGEGLESWTVDYQVLEGDTDNVDGPVWKELEQLLNHQFESENGLPFSIARMGVDAGYNTQTVWNWCRRHGLNHRVYPIKGSPTLMQIITSPKQVDLRSNGKRKKKGARLWPVGVNHIKRELYGWYRLPVPSESNPVPATGFCHFGDFLDEQYFKMLTSEELIRSSKTGREEWDLPSGRRNEALDCRVYNRAMACLAGVDRWVRARTEGGDDIRPAVSVKARRPAQPPARNDGESAPVSPQTRKRRRSSFW